MWHVSPIYHLLQLRLMGIFHLMMALEEKSPQESSGCFVLESWFHGNHTVVETVWTKATIEPLTASTWALWGLRCGFFLSAHKWLSAEIFVSHFKTWRWWRADCWTNVCFPEQTSNRQILQVFLWKGKKLKLCEHSAHVHTSDTLITLPSMCWTVFVWCTRSHSERRVFMSLEVHSEHATNGIRPVSFGVFLHEEKNKTNKVFITLDVLFFPSLHFYNRTSVTVQHTPELKSALSFYSTTTQRSCCAFYFIT